MTTLTSQRRNLNIFIASSTAVLINTIITNPIEVAKLKIQYAPMTCPQYPHSTFSQFYNCRCMKFNYKDAFKGLSVNISNNLISTVSYMQCYEFFRQKFINHTSSQLATLGSALVSRIIVSTFLIPIEAFRVRHINSTKEHKISKSNFGFKVSLVRDVVYSCMFWFTIQKFRNIVSGGEYRNTNNNIQTTIYNNVVPAFFAGGLISAITTPLDTIKTRIQSGINLKGSLREQLKQMYKKEGLIGFFSGVHYRVARNTVGATVYITCYELFLNRLSRSTV